MRGSLEAHLIYATPSELLVAQPVSKATQRLLGSFSQAVRGLKAETVRSGKLDHEEAFASVNAFYTEGPFRQLYFPLNMTGLCEL